MYKTIENRIIVYRGTIGYVIKPHCTARRSPTKALKLFRACWQKVLAQPRAGCLSLGCSDRRGPQERQEPRGRPGDRRDSCTATARPAPSEARTSCSCELGRPLFGPQAAGGRSQRRRDVVMAPLRAAPCVSTARALRLQTPRGGWGATDPVQPHQMAPPHPTDVPTDRPHVCPQGRGHGEPPAPN